MQHVDIRFGLMNYGPFDFPSDGVLRRIRIGIVGSAITIDGLTRWLEHCKNTIAAKPARQPNLFPPFPGCDVAGPFHCEFVVDDAHIRPISHSQIGGLVANSDRNAAVSEIAKAFCAEITALSGLNTQPDVILCALPMEVIEKTVLEVPEIHEYAEDDDAAGEATADEGDAINFRGILKSLAMGLRKPIQIVWPTTYDNDARIHRKLKRFSVRAVQDEATRAWNFFTALYYKAGGLPWRLIRDPKAFRTSYIGISFYRTADREHLLTSTAQVFDERGEGLILQGGRAQQSKEDRNAHLLEQDARELLERSLAAYRLEHHNYPARVVLHKTSTYDQAEMNGFRQALESAGVDLVDFISVAKSKVRLMRKGIYPPLRGTLLSLTATQAVLYTRGSVDFFRTYPGMYIPSPLMLRLHEVSQPIARIGEDVLSLTKMNWNNTQFDGGLPITVRAARYVGEILKYVPEGASIAPRYSYYM